MVEQVITMEPNHKVELETHTLLVLMFSLVERRMLFKVMIVAVMKRTLEMILMMRMLELEEEID